MLNTIILLIISIFLSAFFSGAEVALVSINELKVRYLQEHKRRNAKALRQLKDNSHKTLITILIGNNLVNIGGSALATKLAIDVFDSAGVGIATGIMTFAILTFGEIIPKTYCSKNAVNVSLTIAPSILFLSRLLAPIVWFFNQINKLVDKLTKNENIEGPLVTEEEFRGILKIGEEEGQIKPDEKEMIQRIFLFDDTEAHEIMTPRTEVFALEMRQTLQEILPQLINQEYSRVPVYDKKIDRVKGVIFTRDVLAHVSKGETSLRLKDIAKEALYVPRGKKIDKLLKELQHKKTHMCIVVNEHGGVDGLITIEDILEEIVGDIFDESDSVEHLIRPRGDDQWMILGKTDIDVINKELNLTLPDEEEYNTIAGLIQHHLGRVPKPGEQFFLRKHGIHLYIKHMEGPTILEVILRKKKNKNPLLK